MKLKIFACPECVRGRRFATLQAMNIHIGKNHTVDYRIILINNKPFIKRKSPRGKAKLIQQVTNTPERH